jgi:hypothetical protein
MSAQSTATISTFVNYSAAPEADNFYPTDLDGPRGIYGSLREILAELDRVDPADCPGDLYDLVHDDMVLLRETVIPAAERGVTVLVAHDEDGYYFAREAAPAQTFAIVVECDDRPCPDASGIAHAHLSDDALCGCGAYAAMSGLLTEGDDAPFYRARQMDGSWLVRCPECGAEHTFVGH